MPRLVDDGPAGFQPEPGDLATRFAVHLARQERLCQALEDLADSLPHQLDTRLGLDLARGAFPILRRAHRFEEDILHPLLLRQHPHLAATLARLRSEHLEDEDRAHELGDAIAGLAYDRARREAGTVGYILRGFFSGLRRHLAVEREHLLPLLASIRDG